MNNNERARVAARKFAHTRVFLEAILVGQLLGCCLLATAQTPTVVAGGLSGQQSVGENGAAQYRVALQVPAGVAGMAPQLALSYNSQGSNGLLGMGWGLEGLSAITRCPRTMAQDGVRGRVDFSANDRYCLDGQRLMVVSGSYGAANSEYRTEREAFSKITALGTAGTAPQSFVVKTKAGLTMEYGVTVDSRIEAQGKSEVRVWALNKMQDVKGNYLTISYTEDGVNGDYRPNRIDYSGNQAAGLAPMQSVRFVYQSRPAGVPQDSAPQYLSGSLVKMTVRLSNVQTYSRVGATDTLVHDYRLEYESSPATLRSRLSKISRCNAANQCLQPIVLGWQGSSSAEAAFAFNRSLPGAAVATNSYLDTNSRAIQAGDFNGDGLTDLLHLHPQGDSQYSWVALSNGNGTFNFSRSLPSAVAAANAYLDVSNQQIVTGDFNGDGKTDLLHLQANADPQYSWVALSNGNGTFTFTRSLPGASTATNSYLDANNQQIITGDFNGDGRTDLLHLHHNADPQYSWVALSNGNGTFTFSRNLPGAAVATNSYLDTNSLAIQAGDFNGDGLTDLLHLHPQGDSQYSWVALSKGDGTFTFSRSLPSAVAVANAYLDVSDQQIVTGDFNGDGKTDLLHLQANADPQYSWVALSKGDGTFTFSRSLPGAAVSTNSYLDTNSRAIHAGDFNGDGLTDLLHLHPQGDSQYSWVALSKGDGTFTFSRSLPSAVAVANAYLDVSDQQIVTGDFNGDSLSDLLHLQASADPQYSWVALNQRVTPDYLNQISAGEGVTSLVYKPMTDSTVYTKATTLSTYPRMDMQAPMHVVSAASTSNGAGGSNTTEYQYGEFKVEVGTGRGALGFRWTRNKDLSSGIERYTEYRQNFPYTGMPIKSETRLAGRGSGGLLKRTSYALDCQNPQTVSSCVIASGNRYFTYVVQSVEESWDLGGTAMPVITSTYTYGQNPQYGDPTQVVVGNSAGGTKTTTSTYSNDAANWVLGRLTRAQVSSSSDATPPGTLPQVPTELPQIFTFEQSIPSNTLNYNLRSALMAAGWDGWQKLSVQLTLSGTLGSSSTAEYAFDTGNFAVPTGSSIVLVHGGNIVGRGGDGVSGASSGYTNGRPGGPAMRVQIPIVIRKYGADVVRIGGGGGSGVAYGVTAGGGGAGYPAGSGANGYLVTTTTDDSLAGTLATGGSGGAHTYVVTPLPPPSPQIPYAILAGAGGNLGSAGAQAKLNITYYGTGGVAGAAIVGIGNITWQDSTGATMSNAAAAGVTVLGVVQ